MSDNVNKPSHYNAGEVEAIDGIRSALGEGFADYCKGNVIKYVWRCGKKGDAVEDLRKAATYLQWAIEAMESNCPVIPDSSDRKPLAIPAGWRELQVGETLSKTDMYESNGKWNPYADSNPAGSDFPRYSKGIHYRHIRKIETAETANPSELPNSSMPDPGEGYRLLSKEPLEPVQEGDEFWQEFSGEWVESENFLHETRPQVPSYYYRRKIEPKPIEWIPKVGDRVRVAKGCDLWRYGVIEDIHPRGELFLFQSDDGRYQSWLLADKLHLVEAAS